MLQWPTPSRFRELENKFVTHQLKSDKQIMFLKNCNDKMKIENKKLNSKIAYLETLLDVEPEEDSIQPPEVGMYLYSLTDNSVLTVKLD